MSKKLLSNETIKSVLDKHTKELAAITSAVATLQINSASYGIVDHKIEMHEELYHKPRRSLDKKLAARMTLGGLLLFGFSSYWIWPNDGTQFLSGMCSSISVITGVGFLIGVATGGIK